MVVVGEYGGVDGGDNVSSKLVVVGEYGGVDGGDISSRCIDEFC